MRIRLFTLLAVVAATVFIFAPSAGGVAHAQGSSVVVTSSLLNVRAAPATNSAIMTQLSGGTVLQVYGSVHGEAVTPSDDVWYVTRSGWYIWSGSTAPAGGYEGQGGGGLSGRWIDANLSTATVSAMIGSRVVYSALSTIGVPAHPTPTGDFVILRRVYDETMDSRTIGIPINAPGGYYLKHVLYTQYFTNYGDALHYNYWSPASAFGSQAGSHGCLGLTLSAARFFWNFASVGTPVIVHY